MDSQSKSEGKTRPRRSQSRPSRGPNFQLSSTEEESITGTNSLSNSEPLRTDSKAFRGGESASAASRRSETSMSGAATDTKTSANEKVPRRSNDDVGPGIRYDETREHFIPLRRDDLIRLLAAKIECEQERESFTNLCHLLESIFHFEAHQALRRLKENYAALDPDTAMVEIEKISDEQRDEKAVTFVSELSELLTRANYRELDQPEIDAAIQAASVLGIRLHVDFAQFDRLHVYVRGDMIDRRERRSWRNFYRPTWIEVPIHQRLVVMFRVLPEHAKSNDVNSEYVYIKIFKNIPRSDLDMLLPGSKVRMTLFDRGKILVPTITGIVTTLMKLLKVAAVATLFAGTGILVLLGIVGGTIGYGVKSFFGYINTKDKYRLSVTQHLYFQNLDNNAGVIFRVLNEAEEQEFREAIVAYYLLWSEAGKNGFTKDELDSRAEEFIDQEVGVEVDFEDDDALCKLSRLGLAERNNQGKWTCKSLPDALSCLDEAWDNYFQFHSGKSNQAPSYSIQNLDSPPESDSEQFPC